MGILANYDNHLTNRELEVLQLMAQGITTKEAAQLLFIDYKTVEHHISSLMGKLDATDNRCLAVYNAIQRGIIKLERK